MSTVSGSQYHRVNLGNATSASTMTTATAPQLMPEPTSDMPSGDGMAMIYALIQKQRDNDMTRGETGVTRNREMEHADEVKEMDAIKKQQDAEQNAATWGIFGKIASVVAIAVSAVASVCSCGVASGLCAAACIISAAAFAEGEMHVLTKLTGNPDVDTAFQIGAGIAAALCSGGAGIANFAAALGKSAIGVLAASGQIASSACQIGQESLSAVNDKGCKDAAIALGIGGAACSLLGSVASLGAVAKGASNVAKVVKATSDLVGGATEIGAGATTMVSSQYQADATDRAADVNEAQFAIAQLQQLARWVIDGVKESDKSHERALRTLSSTMQTQAQTLVIASARV